MCLCFSTVDVNADPLSTCDYDLIDGQLICELLFCFTDNIKTNVTIRSSFYCELGSPLITNVIQNKDFSNSAQHLQK